MTLENLYAQLWEAYEYGARLVEIHQEGRMIGTPAYISPRQGVFLRYDSGDPRIEDKILATTRHGWHLGNLIRSIEEVGPREGDVMVGNWRQATWPIHRVTYGANVARIELA